MHNVKQTPFLSLILLAAGMAMPALAQLEGPTIIEFDAPGAGTGAYQGTAAVQINPSGWITGWYFTGSGSVGAYGFVRTPDGNFQSFSPPGAYYTYPQSINPAGEVAGYSYDNAVASGFLRAPGGDLITIEVPGAGTGYGQGTFVWNINPGGGDRGNLA